MPVRIDPHEEEDEIRERILASLGDMFGERPTMSAPYAVRAFELEPLANGELWPRPGDRWQCLVGVEEPMAAVDVVREPDGYHVVSVNHGELAPRLNEAVAAVDERLHDGIYVLSEAEIPDLHIAALHLIDREGEAELFVPVLRLDDGIADIQPLEIYPAPIFASILQPSARRVLETRWE